MVLTNRRELELDLTAHDAPPLLLDQRGVFSALLDNAGEPLLHDPLVVQPPLHVHGGPQLRSRRPTGRPTFLLLGLANVQDRLGHAAGLFNLAAHLGLLELEHADAVVELVDVILLEPALSLDLVQTRAQGV